MSVLVGGWYIPAEDVARKEHPVRYQMAKDIRVIDEALKHVEGRNLVIQAGARVGLWPITLARHFDRVIAFEPESRNFECARLNTMQVPKVELHHAALGKEPGRLNVKRSTEKSGSHWLTEDAGDESCEVRTIDSLNVSPDAMFLDIEGFELFALEGARATIERCKPLLVLEENDARLRYKIERGALTRWLLPYGYGPVARCGKDLIFRAE